VVGRFSFAFVPSCRSLFICTCTQPYPVSLISSAFCRSLFMCVGLFSYVHAPNHILSRSYHQLCCKFFFMCVGLFSFAFVPFGMCRSLFICTCTQPYPVSLISSDFCRFFFMCVGLFSFAFVPFYMWSFL